MTTKKQANQMSVKRDILHDKKKLRQIVENNMVALGAALSARRERIGGPAGLSQRQMTKKMGYDYPSFISSVERGTVKIPNYEMEKFAQHYQLHTGYFLMLATALLYPDVWYNVRLMRPMGSEAMIDEVEQALGNKMERMDTEGLFDVVLKMSTKGC